jgi:hypothetical protein
MSVTEWEGQTPESLQKLKEALDHEFEYLGCSLSMLRIKDVVKRFMKIERSWLKRKYLAGDTQCPLLIQLSDILGQQSLGGESSEDGQCLKVSTQCIPCEKERQKRERR